MKTEARFTHSKVRFDQENTSHLVLSLTAPPPEGQVKRPQLAIIACIDISTSMQGGKLESAKQSALKLVDHLQIDDYFGVVLFGSEVEVQVKPQQITADNKDRLKSEIGKIYAKGSTNFAGGLLKSLELMGSLDLPEAVIHRVIMLTDGAANVGVAVKPDELVKVLTANQGRTSVSAFGYGTDVSSTFLTDFAKSGRGNYAFIAEPDAALAAFGSELGGLLSTYATDITIELTPLNGHLIERVVSDVQVDEEDVTSEITVKVPDLFTEETRNIVLAVKLAEQKQAFPRQLNIIDAKVAYHTIDSDGKKQKHTEEIKVKVQFVKEGEEDKKANADLDKIVALAQVVRAQIEAEEQAKRGDFVAAAASLQDVANSVKTRGLIGVAAAAASIGDRYASRHAYAGSESYRASTSRGMSRGMGVAMYDASAAADLGEIGVVMQNSLMASTSNSFSGGGRGGEGTFMVQPAPGIVDHTGAPLNPGAASIADIVNTLGTVNLSSEGVPQWGVPGGWTSPNSPVQAPTPPQTNSEIKKPRRKVSQPKSKTRW